MGEYILITPAKNEEDNLPEVADSVINQSVRPRLWVIVDDGSVDNTPEIIKELARNYSWIKHLRLPPQRVCSSTFCKRGFRIAYVCKSGIDYAINYSKKHKIGFNYLGILDSDTIIEPNYFEKLIKALEKNERLGIVSGGVHYLERNGKLRWEHTRLDMPRNTGRLYRKEIILDLRYPIEPSHDTILVIKAKNRGWRTAQLKEVIAIQKRLTHSSGGFWKGKFYLGEVHYYIDAGLDTVLLHFLLYSCRYPFYTGLAYLCGYLSMLVNKSPKILDVEIREYNAKRGRYALKYYIKYYTKKLKTFFIEIF